MGQQEIIKAGEIPPLIRFLEEQRERMIQSGRAHSETIYQLEGRIASLQFIIDKYIINTLQVMAPGAMDRFSQALCGHEQLKLSFTESNDVKEAKLIATATEGLDGKEIEKKLWEIEGAQISLCKDVLAKFLAEHEELSKLNKNEVLSKMVEMSKVDAFSKLRELAYDIYRKSSVVQAAKRIQAALPDWKAEEVTRFIAESVASLRKSKILSPEQKDLWDPVRKIRRNIDLVEKTKKGEKIEENFELVREVNVLNDKFSKENESKATEVYNLEFRKHKSKEKANQAVAKIYDDTLKAARKTALQIMREFNSFIDSYNKRMKKAA
jgi:hypothetical protein